MLTVGVGSPAGDELFSSKRHCQRKLSNSTCKLPSPSSSLSILGNEYNCHLMKSGQHLSSKTLLHSFPSLTKISFKSSNVPSKGGWLDSHLLCGNRVNTITFRSYDGRHVGGNSFHRKRVLAYTKPQVLGYVIAPTL